MAELAQQMTIYELKYTGNSLSDNIKSAGYAKTTNY